MKYKTLRANHLSNSVRKIEYMRLLEPLFDPFVGFCVICLVTPVLVQWQDITKDDIVNYLFEPSMVFSIILLFATTLETSMGKCVPLTMGERFRARWYLLNGAIIHILMDGLVGVFKTNSLMAKNYKKLDARYGDVVGEFRGSAVHIISLCELIVKGPICLVLYRAYHRGSAHRDLLEFFTCVTQVYGTVVYLGQEAISGMTNFDVDYNLSFSLHFLIYFWFAVAVGCILWLAVPTYLGWQSYKRILVAQRHWQNTRPMGSTQKRAKQ